MFHTPKPRRTGGRTSSLDETATTNAPKKGGPRRSIEEREPGWSRCSSPLRDTFTVDPPPTPRAPACSPVMVSNDSPVNTAAAAVKPRPRPVPKSKTTSSPAGVAVGAVSASPSTPAQTDRVKEARDCLIKVKTSLSRSGNLKRDIKADVQAAVERMYALVKEIEAAKGHPTSGDQVTPAKQINKIEHSKLNENQILQKLEDNNKILQENNRKIESLTKLVEEQKEKQSSRNTYANVAANRKPPAHTTLHSVVVTGEISDETGDQVLERIRKAVRAKEGMVAVERIRQTHDRKVIIGCKTEEERQKVKEKITKQGQHLIVEEIKNKHPLVILKDILKYNSDEDVLSSLRTQNKELFRNLTEEESSHEIAYKKPARNPLAQHVVLRVAPRLWQRMVDEEAVHVDLQRIRVADQSPLVQCSLCLEYGHGRRFCKDTLEKCSHCGGPHKKADCADWRADTAPSCCNCIKAKLGDTAHNAFSRDCVVRRRWDALARAKIAYC